MIKINQVELASNLADRELIDKWDHDEEELEIEKDGCIYYTEKAQDIFNELYDEFYTMIENCEEGEFNA